MGELKFNGVPVDDVTDIGVAVLAGDEE